MNYDVFRFKNLREMIVAYLDGSRSSSFQYLNAPCSEHTIRSAPSIYTAIGTKLLIVSTPEKITDKQKSETVFSNTRAINVLKGLKFSDF